MLRRIGIVAALIALYSASVFTTNGCASDPVQVETVLGGRVIDAATGRPIRNADVGIQSVGARTDENGVYFIPRLSPGRYLLTVTHPDYRTAEVEVELRQGNNNREVQLTPR
jgi:protocatechuate 3,4-dioxygenase beta subunit